MTAALGPASPHAVRLLRKHRPSRRGEADPAARTRAFGPVESERTCTAAVSPRHASPGIRLRHHTNTKEPTHGLVTHQKKLAKNKSLSAAPRHLNLRSKLGPQPLESVGPSPDILHWSHYPDISASSLRATSSP